MGPIVALHFWLPSGIQAVSFTIKRIASRQACSEETAEQVQIARNQVWGRQLPTGTLLLCLSGALWITRDSERKDDILQSGEQIMLASPAHVVASSLGELPEAAMLVVECAPDYTK